MSLRDVDRTLQVMMWFYQHDELCEMMDRKADAEADSETDEEEPAPLQVALLLFVFNVLYIPYLHDEQQLLAARC